MNGTIKDSTLYIHSIYTLARDLQCLNLKTKNFCKSSRHGLILNTWFRIGGHISLVILAMGRGTSDSDIESLGGRRLVDCDYLGMSVASGP